MLRKVLLLASLTLVGACSAIPDLPDLPGLQSVGSIIGSEGDGEVGGDAERLLEGYKSKGNGYLSFTYNAGHLDQITVRFADEEIVISKGTTAIKKMPVGRYSVEVSGNQKLVYRVQPNINYDGETVAYSFDAPLPGSVESRLSVKSRNLVHGMSTMIIGSSLVGPQIEIVKLDSPTNIFEADPNCQDSCGPTNRRKFVSPLTLQLPEGKYSITSSDESREIYINASTVSTIEIKADGFQVETREGN